MMNSSSASLVGSVEVSRGSTPRGGTRAGSGTALPHWGGASGLSLSSIPKKRDPGGLRISSKA